ncbi:MULTISPECIES: hypothetical protein [Nocardia]|uniref:hypothetical protein n=2 Tax=Nocardiaceae TaxID=85025 RepID=UPI0024565247|nr:MULTISPECIES: hypothetical protein [Nocardia]
MTAARQRATESPSEAQLQSTIATPIYRDTVGVIIGMQDDVDSTYSMRRFLEDMIPAYCQILEEKYNGGRRWPTATRIVRGGINPVSRSAGEVTPLQSWVATAVRGRLYGTVNGMKKRIPTYTLRDFLETASNRHIAQLKQQHPEHRWPPREHLRRGRRATPDIPME